MGSYPGPACYGLGGDQPTLTDAFVTAGLINPEYFLGGTKSIDLERARKTIADFVAQPLNVSAEEACRIIIDHAFASVAAMILAAKKSLREDLSNSILFAYGGNGSLFACGVAEKAGLRRVQLFSLGSVFSAFGSSVSDISHLYEGSLAGVAPSEAGATRIRQMLEEMKAEGVKDLLGEGIRPEGITYACELDASRNGHGSIAVPCNESSLRSEKDLRATLANALSQGADAPSDASIWLELLRVSVKKQMPKPHLVERTLQSPDSSHALKGRRKVTWGSSTGEAQIYNFEALQPGNQIKGCAILEDVNTTYFVPENWQLTMDRFRNAGLTRSPEKR
jgi:N-methylhydantoinase A/oxoprolinase/acetone carboxylase beta subunit